MPAARAAYPRPCPKLPADAQTTPGDPSPASRIHVTAPRPLNERIGLSVSTFSASRAPVTASSAVPRSSGEPREHRVEPAAARSISATVGTTRALIAPAARSAPAAVAPRRLSALSRIRPMCAAIAACAAAPSPAAIASTIARCSTTVCGRTPGRRTVYARLSAPSALVAASRCCSSGLSDASTIRPCSSMSSRSIASASSIASTSARATQSRSPATCSGVGPLGGQRRRARLEQEPDLEEVLEPALGQREHELQRAQQLVHAERGDERPRAVPALEDVHRLERPDRLAHRRARDAERLRQAALGRQPLAGREPAVEDHVLDRPDRLRHVGPAGQRLELDVAHIAQNGS